MQTVCALVLTLPATAAINCGYLIEHGAAAGLPPLSVRRPFRTIRLLLASRLAANREMGPRPDRSSGTARRRSPGHSNPRSDMNETVITPEGMQRLSEELQRLLTEGRREITERLRHAAATEANPDENADYLGVREDQALLERRIALLEARLGSARVVEPQVGNGRIDVGERVRLRNLESGERLELELVGPLEADPSGGRISIASPLGKAIHGLRRGQIAEVDAPRGTLRFKILAVEVAA